MKDQPKLPQFSYADLLLFRRALTVLFAHGKAPEHDATLARLDLHIAYQQYLYNFRRVKKIEEVGGGSNAE